MLKWYLNRPGKPKGMHYLSHQTVDTDHGIILDVMVTSGEVSDAVPYLDQIEYVHREVIPIQCATADAIYDFPLWPIRYWASMESASASGPLSITNRRRWRSNGMIFVMMKQMLAIFAPTERMRLNTLRRSSSGLHWVYSAQKRDCQACPLKEKRLSECRKKGTRKLERSYVEPAVRRDLERQKTPEYREALRLRQIWCEG